MIALIESHPIQKGEGEFPGLSIDGDVSDTSDAELANVADITQVDKLLYGTENVTYADAAYRGVEKHGEPEGC